MKQKSNSSNLRGISISESVEVIPDIFIPQKSFQTVRSAIELDNASPICLAPAGDPQQQAPAIKLFPQLEEIVPHFSSTEQGSDLRARLCKLSPVMLAVRKGDIITLADGDFRNLDYLNRNKELVIEQKGKTIFEDFDFFNGQDYRIDGKSELHGYSIFAWVFERTKISIQLSGVEELFLFAPQCTYLNVSNNELSRLHLVDCAELQTLDVQNNELTNLNVDNLENLEELSAQHNRLVDVSCHNCGKLERVKLQNNQILDFDFNMLCSAKQINVGNNCLRKIAVERLKHLLIFQAYDNKLLQCQFSSCGNLMNIEVDNNQIVNFNLAGCEQVKKIKINNNQLRESDFSELPELSILKISNNKLTTLKIANCPNLAQLYLEQNSLQSIELVNVSPQIIIQCDEQLQIGGKYKMAKRVK